MHKDKRLKLLLAVFSSLVLIVLGGICYSYMLKEQEEDKATSNREEVAGKNNVPVQEEEVQHHAPLPAPDPSASHYEALADQCIAKSDYETAEQHLLAALAIKENKLGPNHADTADTYHRLRYLHGSQSREP